MSKTEKLNKRLNKCNFDAIKLADKISDYVHAIGGYSEEEVAIFFIRMQQNIGHLDYLLDEPKNENNAVEGLYKMFDTFLK